MWMPKIRKIMKCGKATPKQSKISKILETILILVLIKTLKLSLTLSLCKECLSKLNWRLMLIPKLLIGPR